MTTLMNSTVQTPKVGKFKAATLATLTLLGVSVLPIAAGATTNGTDNGHQDNLSELVDTYENHQSFRGIANDQLPINLNEGLDLGNIIVQLDGHQGIARDGYVDYGLTTDGLHVIAASDGQHMDRFAIVIHEGGADHYTIPVKLPEHATVDNLPTGTIEVTDANGDTTTLAPASAVDAAGKILDASYRIEDETLKVTVDLDDAQYPVMVDPVSATYWWGTQTWYSRADVRQSASWYGVIGIAAQACNAFGNSTAINACKKTVGAYTNWIYNTWMDAKNNNQCLWMKMTWTGQVIGIGRYDCNWG